MKFRTLLLGTAAAFTVAGGAQAADLAVAEPVEYVKVCDAYGAGYWYVPGTDTCLHVGGYVLFDTIFYDDSRSLNAVGYTGLPTVADYTASWKFYTEEQLDFTARFMTDWGMGVAFVAIRSNHDAATIKGVNNLGYLDTAYLKIGPLKAGYDASTYDYGFNGLIDTPTAFDHDVHQNQLQFSTQFGGIGVLFGIEDPRDNVGGSGLYTGDLPDLVLALTGSMGGLSWKWSAATTDTTVGTGWGTQLGASYSWGGSFLKIQAAVSNGAGAAYGAGLTPMAFGDGTYWHVSGQGGIAWTSAFSTLLEAGYRGDPTGNAWEAAAEADWTIAKNVATGVEFYYIDPEALPSTWQVTWRTKVSFGS